MWGSFGRFLEKAFSSQLLAFSKRDRELETCPYFVPLPGLLLLGFFLLLILNLVAES